MPAKSSFSPVATNWRPVQVMERRLLALREEVWVQVIPSGEDATASPRSGPRYPTATNRVPVQTMEYKPFARVPVCLTVHSIPSGEVSTVPGTVVVPPSPTATNRLPFQVIAHRSLPAPETLSDQVMPS